MSSCLPSCSRPAVHEERVREAETNSKSNNNPFNKAPDGRGGIRGASRKRRAHHRMRNEDLGLVAIVLLLHFLSRDGLEADLHHGSASRFRPASRGLSPPDFLRELHARVRVRGEMRLRRLHLRLAESSSSRSWAASPHCFVLICRKCFFFFFACSA